MVTDVMSFWLNRVLLELTFFERWDAAGRFVTDVAVQKWFITVGLVSIAVLTVLFFVVNRHRVGQERKFDRNLFFEYAEQRGLSDREREILLEVAQIAGVKRPEAIFHMADAFESGVAEMIMEKQAGSGGKVDGRLRSCLVFLREKLGFVKVYSASIGSVDKSKKRSSRSIVVGKKLYITNLKDFESDEIEASIIENVRSGLKLKLPEVLRENPGETWRARYYFGGSVWEFDTTAVRCEEDVLVLNHSNNVRFINRRRFLRVSVKRAGFIASFPFVRHLSRDAGDEQLPQLHPAVITELAGPGLRVESGLEAKRGDRVLVTFQLDEEAWDESKSKVVEDIGIVRNARSVEAGWLLAVELTGLSDSELNELIRATNAASIKRSGANSGSGEATFANSQGVLV